MRVLLFGGTGAIGRPLIRMLVAAGHEVTATTRRPERAALVEALGARAAVLDALDADAVARTVEAAAPDAAIDQLTDLAGLDFAANTRLRVEGTRAIVAALRAAGVDRLVAESVSWVVAPGPVPADEDVPYAGDAVPGVEELESATLGLPEGVVLRYGQLYGPGTWFSADGLQAEEARAGRLGASRNIDSFVHVEDAARAALLALDWPAGIVNVVDDDPAHAADWIPVFARAVGAEEAEVPAVERPGRPVSNAKAKALGWRPSHPSWRTGFALG